VFNLSGSEIIIILILALVVLGPDKLPDAMRRAGRTWGELKKLSSGFQEEVRKGFDEPTKEVRETAKVVRNAAAFPSKKLTYNPLKDKPPALPEGESVAAPDPDELPVAAPDSDEPPAAESEPDQLPAAAPGAVADATAEDPPATSPATEGPAPTS
jgi:sec-independent protein translocase protein TatB